MQPDDGQYEDEEQEEEQLIRRGKRVVGEDPPVQGAPNSNFLSGPAPVTQPAPLGRNDGGPVRNPAPAPAPTQQPSAQEFSSWFDKTSGQPPVAQRATGNGPAVPAQILPDDHSQNAQGGPDKGHPQGTTPPPAGPAGRSQSAPANRQAQGPQVGANGKPLVTAQPMGGQQPPPQQGAPQNKNAILTTMKTSIQQSLSRINADLQNAQKLLYQNLKGLGAQTVGQQRAMAQQGGVGSQTVSPPQLPGYNNTATAQQMQKDAYDIADLCDILYTEGMEYAKTVSDNAYELALLIHEGLMQKTRAGAGLTGNQNALAPGAFNQPQQRTAVPGQQNWNFQADTSQFMGGGGQTNTATAQQPAANANTATAQQPPAPAGSAGQTQTPPATPAQAGAQQKTQMTLNTLFTNLKQRIEGEYNTLLKSLTQYLQQAS